MDDCRLVNGFKYKSNVNLVWMTRPVLSELIALLKEKIMFAFVFSLKFLCWSGYTIMFLTKMTY